MDESADIGSTLHDKKTEDGIRLKCTRQDRV